MRGNNEKDAGEGKKKKYKQNKMTDPVVIAMSANQYQLTFKILSNKSHLMEPAR